MSENIDKRWLYLAALRTKVKIKLKGDPSLKITSDDILDLEVKIKLGKATLERFFGNDKAKTQRYPNANTRDTFARYVGYKSYNIFVIEYLKQIIPPNEHTDILPKVPLPTDHPIAPYLNPCIDMMTSFAFRLKEIFEGRGSFLLKDAPQTDFNEYRYISTIYRFCAVLAWIRVIKKEESFLRIKDEYQVVISKAILKFQNALADGKEVESLITNDLCKIFNFNISEWPSEILVNISIKIDHILHLYRHQNQVKQMSELNEKKQKELLADILKNIMSISKTTCQNTHWNNDLAIAQLSRTQRWIYFDWQTAIGDIMLERTNRPQKAYEVIGFADFETYFLDNNFKNKRWFKRAEKLFIDFDIQRPESFDARNSQLKKVFKSSVHLIEVFILLQKGGDSTIPEHIEMLKKVRFL